MPLILNGKYWRVSDLEKKFQVPHYKILQAIKGLEGVCSIGHSYIIPDELVPKISSQLKAKCDGLTLLSASNKIRISPQTIKKIIEEGFPTFEYEGIERISHAHLPILQAEVDKIRERDGRVGMCDAKIICTRALKKINSLNE